MLQQVEWQELLERAEFPDVMKDENGEFQPMMNMGLKYKEFVEPLYQEIEERLDRAEKAPRVALEERQLPDVFHALRSFFENETGVKCDEITITRMNETEMARPTIDEFVREKHWISELWHVDNYGDGHFKVMIYCNEVTKDNAPTEIREPVECYLHKRTASSIDGRFDDTEPGTLFTCPAFTTLIFTPAIKHKGNYSRKGYRDLIMLGFNYGGYLGYGRSASRFSTTTANAWRLTKSVGAWCFKRYRRLVGPLLS